MPEGTFTVVAKSAYGIKIKQDGPWWNFTKPEFRGERFNTSVKKGDRVQIEYQEKEYSDPETGERLIKYFISSIDLVTRREQPLVENEPFPPVDDFPPDDSPGFGIDDGKSLDASGEPSVTPETYGQDLWAKDKLRARTDCVACATGIFKSCLEAGILKDFPSAAAVVAYATELEKWAKE